jgi:uncharacterized protein YeaO (DUF488 family)
MYSKYLLSLRQVAATHAADDRTAFMRIDKDGRRPRMSAPPAQFDIRLKRAYEPATEGDGTRILVDRLWPRGVTKADAAIDRWFRDLAPSSELRKWFGHDPARWQEFQRRYTAELRQHRELLDELRRLASEGRLTLVYGARDEKHNDAVVLKDVLQSRSNDGT